MTSRRVHAATAAVAVALATTLLAGCTDSPTIGTASPSATGAPSATTPAPASDLPTGVPTGVPTEAGPAFPADTRPDIGAGTGGPLGLRVARAAAQPGYDRVVFELGGSTSGTPGWRVSYVDRPVQDPSGEPVAVAGTAFLEVFLEPVGTPDDTGVAEPAVRRFSPAGLRLVREVVLDGGFEGQYQAFIGLSARRPFRVFRLSNPARVVVDIRHS